MNVFKWAVMVVVATGAMWTAGGCSATPVGLAASLIGTAVNDEDVKSKSKELMGVSAGRCDSVLGLPNNIYRSQQPPREWRVYPVKDDVTGNFRYVVEFCGGKVVEVNKVETIGDVVVDAATEAYFADKCMGKTARQCETNLGLTPALTVENSATGQVTQIYDARLIGDIQKPYYGVVRFSPEGLCDHVSVATVAASTANNPAGQ